MHPETIQPPDRIERADEGTAQRKAYRELLDLLRDVPDLTEGERAGLAFLVDVRYHADATRWEDARTQWMAELRSAQERGGISEVTWLLAEDLRNRYGAFLVEAAERAVQPHRAILEHLRERVDGTHPMRADVHDAHQRVPIGSVSLDHAPTWSLRE